jgi:hypothetical protein
MANSQSSSNSSSGIGVLGLLGVTFVVLTLTGVIDWSWWWVTLPFWSGLALAFLIISVFVAVGVIKHLLKR